jgi:hypothetical protein
MKVYVDNVLEAEATFSTFSNSTSMAVGASLNWTLYFGSGSYNANFWPSLSGSHTFSLDYTINFDHA